MYPQMLLDTVIQILYCLSVEHLVMLVCLFRRVHSHPTFPSWL